jgi:hypothetical protein
MRSLLACLVSLVLAAPVAGQAIAVLGRDGEIFRVLETRLPGAVAEEPGNAVLTLEIVAEGSDPRRLVVPGTAGEEIERYPYVAVDDTTGSVFVVWEAQRTIHSTLHITSYSGGEWSPVMEISGDRFSEKSNPRLAVTSDQYTTLDDAGQPEVRTRTLLHLVWFDRAGYGDRPLYAPMVVEDGQLSSTWSVVDLPALLAESGVGSESPSRLATSPTVTASPGGKVIVCFVDPATGRLATIATEMISGGLAAWTDEARHQIIDIGRSLTGGTRSSLAERVKAELVGPARALLSAELADVLVRRLGQGIADSDPTAEVDVVAQQVHDDLIDVAQRLNGGLRATTAEARHQIIDIGRRALTERSMHLASFAVVSVWDAPSLPDRSIQVLSSPDGTHVTLAWDAADAVRYRQSQGTGWSDIRSLALDQRLTRDEAYALLTKQLDRR